MARATPELLVVCMSRNQRDRTDSTRSALHKLLVHGGQGETGEGEGSCNEGYRVCTSGSGGEIDLVCLLLVSCIPYCFIMLYLTDVLHTELSASPKSVVCIALLLPTLALRQHLPFVHFRDLYSSLILEFQPHSENIVTHLLRSCCVVCGFVVPYPYESREAKRDTPLFDLYGPSISTWSQHGSPTRTSPCAAVYTGLRLRSAVRTSQTILGSNHTSGFAPPTLMSPLGFVISNGFNVS